MLLKASIDLGTNTCLLLIAEWDEDEDRIGRVLGDFQNVVRLGQGVDVERKLHPEAKNRTLACLHDYAAKVRNLGGDPSRAICVATSQARDARDSGEFFAQVERETGFRFRVISGEEEARCTFLGALLPGMDPARAAVIDIGGGSTEIVTRSGGASVGQSLDIGSVRFTERFIKSDPVQDEEFWACQRAIDDALAGLKPGIDQRRAQGPLDLVAVAGTATSLAQWHLGLEKFDARAIDECTLTRGDIHRLVEELKWRNQDERRAIPGMEPKRADVLLAGAMILWRAHEVLGFPSCRVSTRGLRYGVLSRPS